MSLTTLADAKAYLGVTALTWDAEISRLVAAADGVVQSHAGPALARGTFTERHTADGVLMLRRYPVVSVTSVGLVVGGVVTPYAGAVTGFGVIDADAGKIACPFASGTVEVVYVAGLATVPPEAEIAALKYVKYEYQRNHGGSASYTPAGADASIAPPQGVPSIEAQLRLALGEFARGPSIG